MSNWELGRQSGRGRCVQPYCSKQGWSMVIYCLKFFRKGDKKENKKCLVEGSRHFPFPAISIWQNKIAMFMIPLGILFLVRQQLEFRGYFPEKGNG